ncbi:19228_t:CDS:2, partial [Cetraspora pellucida]
METNKEIELKDNNDLDIPRLNKYYRSAWRSLELDNSKLDQRCDFLQNKFKNVNSFDKNEKMRCNNCHNLTYSIRLLQFIKQLGKMAAKKLLRYGKQLVILKMLNSSDKDKNNLDWFDEFAQYLIPCPGVTKDPNTGNFMLVLRHMMTNLRNFLLENNSTITWEQRYDILYEITSCLNEIHRKDHVHRDLHSEYAILMEQCWNATSENKPE